MARKFPRFLFSNPKDTKSQGPFIVHTLFPQMIIKVTYREDGGHQVDALEVFGQVGSEEINRTVYAAYDWYTHTRMQEANLLPDFYETSSDIARQVSGSNYFTEVSISMVYKPLMGAKLDVSKDNWKLSVGFVNGDTYHSLMQRLEDMFIQKIGHKPNWPIPYKKAEE